jgi:hypothetical protein
MEDRERQLSEEDIIALLKDKVSKEIEAYGLNNIVWGLAD